MSETIATIVVFLGDIVCFICGVFFGLSIKIKPPEQKP